MESLSRRKFFGLAAAAGASVAGAAPAALVSQNRRDPEVTLALSDYIRFTPLATGDLDPEGVTFLRGPRSDMLRRALSDPGVDGGESSMLGHLLKLDRGDRSMVAIPVFPLRNFTARDIYIRRGSPLTPSDLNGRRVGIYNWAASGAVWYRQLIRYFGQDPTSMTWTVGGIDEPRRVEARAPLPEHVADAPPNRSMADLLLNGDLDAFFAPLPPRDHDADNGPIVRLVPQFRGVETQYFEDTRFFPTQHVLLIRRATWERGPEIGHRLLEIFAECETRFQDGQHLFPYSSPWQLAEVEETDRLMGSGFHAHGLENARHEVDMFCQSAYEDGLTERRVSVDEYFAEFLES